MITDLIEKDCYIVGLLGIGTDGHTSGIKPMQQQQFKQFTGDEYYIGYHGHDFQRVTSTARALMRIDRSIVYAEGAKKWEQYQKLSDTIPDHVQPAQILKRCSDISFFINNRSDV